MPAFPCSNAAIAPYKEATLPRTLLNADSAQALANEIFDDDGALAVFNVIFELQNGKLTSVDEGSDAADDDAVELAGVIGHCQFHGEEFSYQESIDEDDEHKETIIRLAVAAVGELSTGDVMLPEATEIDGPFPSTLALMAVWRGGDGRYWTAFYRHPEIAAGMAALILKNVVEEFGRDEHPGPASSN